LELKGRPILRPARSYSKTLAGRSFLRRLLSLTIGILSLDSHTDSGSLRSAVRPLAISVTPPLITVFVVLFPLAVLAVFPLLLSAQSGEDLIIPTPLTSDDTLIIGFQGGRDRWDNQRVGVGRMALRLKLLQTSRLYVQTFENRKRELALRFVREALDRDHDGVLSGDEAASARIVLYGESFGGAAVIKFARQLRQFHVPVLLTVQIDSVGLGHEVVPNNVRCAANLFQRNGRFVRGPENIRAADPSRTHILGNWRFDYRNSAIDISDLPWYKTILRKDHSCMDRDPLVWQRVEELIISAIGNPDSISSDRSQQVH
jgi:hypothetical protein